MQQDFLAEVVAVEVHINFGSSYFLVTQHLLDSTQVSAALEEVCGKAVAEGVGRDGSTDSRLLSQRLHNMKDGDAAERGAATNAKKYRVLVPWTDCHLVTIVEPASQLFYGARRDGHQAFFFALTVYADVALVQKEVAEFQSAELADAKPAGVQRLDNGTVSLAFGFVEIYGIYEEVYFCDCEYIRQWLLREGDSRNSVGSVLISVSNCKNL